MDGVGDRHPAIGSPTRKRPMRASERCTGVGPASAAWEAAALTVVRTPPKAGGYRRKGVGTAPDPGLVPWMGFEPTTFRSGGGRPIRWATKAWRPDICVRMPAR